MRIIKSLSCLLFLNNSLNATTLVYNMKIRRAFGFGASAFDSKGKAQTIVSSVPIVYKRNRHIVTTTPAVDVFDKNTIAGFLFNVRYRPSKYCWFEGATGIEKEKASVCGTSNFTHSRAGFDDFVFTLGANIYPKEKWQVAPYLIWGFPSKRQIKETETFDTLVGTRFYSLGEGIEVSYSFIESLEQSLVGIFQQRFIHFFSRNFFPVLDKDSILHPGNVTDVLFTLQYRKLRNIVEFGYNPTFFTNIYVFAPQGTTKTDNFVRNGVYASFAHVCKKFPIITKPTIIGLGFNVSRTKVNDAKTFATWMTFTTIF